MRWLPTIALLSVVGPCPKAIDPSSPTDYSAALHDALFSELESVSITKSAEQSLLDLLAATQAELEQAEGPDINQTLADLHTLGAAIREAAVPAEGMTEDVKIVGSPAVSQGLASFCPVWPICPGDFQ